MTTVLIVDDDPMILESTQLYLESHGFDTLCAHDGDEAFEQINANRVHVALVDIFMPKRDGYQFILTLKDSLPIIAMSGVTSSRFEPLEFAQTLGASATLSKPFEPKKLLHTIDHLLNTAH